MPSYRDIDFSFTKNSFTNDLNVVEDSRSIRQSIKNILLTFNGERSFNIPFGASLYENLFDSFDDVNIDLANKILVTLNRYEPRIRVTKVSPTIINDKLNIDLDYKYSLGGQTIVDKATVQLDIEES
tara:strand:+ start:204 stop:584 length:381 start_codon:yes stop_codon:yes gene_type:complete